MSKKTENTNVATVETSTTFGGITFNTETMLKEYEKITVTSDGKEIISYEMPVDLVDKSNGDSLVITDKNAIESIVGLRNSDKLEKWASFRKGAYLVQLVDSQFMIDNDIKSVEKLAKMINLGVEGSSANSLENVSRKLGVSFDDNGNLHFTDETLPLLSFWHYNNIISLVTQNDDGSYNYDSLKDFLVVANVSPIMSQKRLKELFNDYRNGRITGNIAIPDKVSEKAVKDAKRAAENKEKAEKAKAIVSAKTAIENATTFTEKQAVALSALQAFEDTVKNLGAELSIDFDEIRLLITSLEEVIPTATPKEK